MVHMVGSTTIYTFTRIQIARTGKRVAAKYFRVKAHHGTPKYSHTPADISLGVDFSFFFGGSGAFC